MRYAKRRPRKKTTRRKARVQRNVYVKGLTVTPFKLKMDPTNLTAAGNLITFRMSMTNYNRAMNVLGGGYSAYNEVSSIQALYDQYQPTYLKMKYFPQAPNATGLLFAPMYIISDPDDADATDLGSLTSAITYDNCKIFNLYKPWTFKMRLNKIKVSSGGSGSAPVSPGWFDTSSLPVIGAVKAIATGLTNGLYGTVTCSMWIKCRERR